MSDLLTMYEQDLPGGAKRVSSHRGGEWHGPCPVCGGNKRFRLQPAHGDNGYFKCRDCGVGGDDVDYLVKVRSLSKAAAMREQRGQVPLAQHPVSTPQPTLPETSEWIDRNIWQRAARDLCDQAHEDLLSKDGAQGLHYLKSRGLKDDAIRRANLGYIPATRYEPSAKWGKSEKDVYVPGPSVVIPRCRNGQVWGVKFRQLEREPKYIQIAGSQPVLYGADTIKHEFMIMTEGEFDCLLLQQEIGDLCDVTTIGSATSDIPAEDLLSFTPVKKVLLAYDLDDAGMMGSVKLATEYPGFIVNARSPGDFTDYHIQGNNLRNWAVEEFLLAGADIPPADIFGMYNERLRQHDNLEAEVNRMPDTPERDRKLAEHNAVCDNMSRLITAIKAAGYTVTKFDAVYGFGDRQ